MSKKPVLKLVSTKLCKKLYELVTTYTQDGEIFSFSLAEWDMYESYEWIEFRKKDKKVTEWFPTNNISRISFTRSDGKPESKPTLLPVA